MPDAPQKHPFHDIAPALADITTDVLFGDVWKRPGLSPRDRRRPIIGDRRPPSELDQIQPEHWLPEYTDDLIDLLNVLGRLIALEPAQADLLERICAGPLIDRNTISALTAEHESQARAKKPKAKAGG